MLFNLETVPARTVVLAEILGLVLLGVPSGSSPSQSPGGWFRQHLRL